MRALNTRKIGSEYERYAKEYLTEHGYRIVKSNYRCRCGEIDVIAWDREYLCFIEVKYRATTAGGYPQEAVDRKKQKRIYRAAARYLQEQEIAGDIRCRFDVIGICPPDIWLITNAFGGI